MKTTEMMIADSLKEINDNRQEKVEQIVRDIVKSMLDAKDKIKILEKDIQAYKNTLKELKAPAVAVVEL